MSTANHQNQTLSETAGQPRTATVRHLPLPVETTNLVQEQIAYEQRLIGWFIHEVRQTGLCDYPSLVERVNCAYEIDKTDAKSVLTPRTIQVLCDNINRANADVQLGAQSLTRIIRILIEKLGNQPMPNPAFLVQLEQEIGENLQPLSEGVDYLLNLVQQYPPSTSPNPSIEEELESDRFYKLVNDIQYIRNYLITQAHVQTLVSEFPGGHEASLYFRRLYQYLDVLPQYCNAVGAIARRTLEDKVIGAKFATPAIYKGR